MRNKTLTCLVALIFTGTNLIAQTSGYFGGDAASSGYLNAANTAGKWLKLGELTLNGAYSSAGLTVDFFVRNSNHGDGEEKLHIGFRNEAATGISQLTYDIVLIHSHGQHKTVSDAKVVHTSGSGVINNKLSIWLKMSASWLFDVPIEVRTHGAVSFETTNQPYYPTIQDTGITYDLKTYTSLSEDIFEVRGTIRSKEVKVEVANWPDYVFSPEYNLKSLQETEIYIKENKRLPDMPSAEEVAENGIALGEMNRLLLEKVEELTMHQIEQSEQIRLLIENNEKLINRIKKLEE